MKSISFLFSMSRKVLPSRSAHHTSMKELSDKLAKIRLGAKNSFREFSTKSSSIDTLIESIKNNNYKRIVVLAGAGISTPSGIPDFRTPGTGLYDNLQRYNIPYPEAIFELNYFYRNPQPFFHLAKELYPGRFSPNIIHYFIRHLHDLKLLHRVYTQNIDGLERLAGVPAEKIVEAHGTFLTATCQRCRQKYECEDIREEIFDEQIPKCKKTPRCTGVIKPDIVFFGEDLPRRFQLYMQDLPMCDLCIVMGTSLAVYPFADIIDSTTRSTTRLLINREVVGTFRAPRSNDVTMIGDLEMNVKQLLTKLDWIDVVMQLMKKEIAEQEQAQQQLRQTARKKSSAVTTAPLNNRLKLVDSFFEKKRQFSTLASDNRWRRQESQPKSRAQPVITESNKLLAEKHNDALLFNRRRSKSALPIIPPAPPSSSSSTSTSASLHSSSPDSELMPFSFKQTPATIHRPSDQIVPISTTISKR